MNFLRDLSTKPRWFSRRSLLFPYGLLGTSLFFTLYLGFPQIRYFPRGLRIVWGKRIRETCPG